MTKRKSSHNAFLNEMDDFNWEGKSANPIRSSQANVKVTERRYM